MKYFITGGAGFIGSNFIRFLLKKSHAVSILNFDKLTYAGNLANLSEIQNNVQYRFFKGDICKTNDVSAAFEQFDPDYVINFAAESHVDKSITDPDIFIKTNVLEVQNLLQTSLQYDVKKYIQISTDEVYGSLGKTGKFKETTSLSPSSPYSASKASADLLSLAYFHTYNLPINITRCSNNFGPYQFPEKLIPLTILKCINMEKIPIYGDGLNIRDWIHVNDHCSAIDLVLKKGIPGDIYNVGADNERSNIEIVKNIINIISDLRPNLGVSEELITYIEDRKGHDRRYAIDAARIHKKLNWVPSIPFETGLVNTIKWYLDNTQWLDSIRLAQKCKY